MSCCAHRNILIKSCLVLSTETRLGQAAPLVVDAEAILAACPLVVEAVAEGPVRAPDVMSCPEEASASELSLGGLPVPVCLAMEGCPVPVLFLPCPVCIASEGS